MSVGSATKFGAGQHVGQPLFKRTSDNAYVHVFYSPYPFLHNGVVIAAAASWIESDGTTYTAKTAAQIESGYTPAANNHNVSGR